MRHSWVVVAAAIMALTFVAGVMAHAEPATVTPGDGAVLNTPPAQIIIETTQEMARQAGANDIQIVDASGKTFPTPPARIDDNDRKKLTLEVPPGLPVGIYTVKWQTLSADDGDAADGTLSFTFDPSKPPSPGKTQLQASTGPVTTAVARPAALKGGPTNAGPPGTTWIVLAAGAMAALVIISGGAFLLVTKNT
jgi:methionine-rich copper-binding protein CopC